MTCEFPACTQNVYANGLCFNHNRIFGSNPVRQIEVKEIPKKSLTQKELDKEYSKLVQEMKAESVLCEVKVKGVCTHIMEGLHHLQKRTRKNMCERSNVIRACNACNSWIEQNPLDAISLGLSISKHKKP